jgi:iron complex transport system substrate-binding protein
MSCFNNFKTAFFLLSALLIVSCKEEKKEVIPRVEKAEKVDIRHARGFSVSRSASGLTIIEITSPWPNAENAFTYALIPREILPFTTLNSDEYDAIVTIPVERLVVTSTTHIPALEALGVGAKLVGFPDAKYISSKATRARIDAGQLKDLGSNESINTEMTIALNPEVVIGFSIDNQNKAYETLQRSNIPVVYNGDWTEETPLGKAEWIKFFAPFFGLEKKADSIFNDIETSYNAVMTIASDTNQKPTVLSGALYKDVWYLPGGNSWAAQFLKDANVHYLWEDTTETGSLSLSLESVFDTAKSADYWISPSQFISYDEMLAANRHYEQFEAFQTKKVYTFARTTGETGGLLYYELGPNRPDLVLKDLVHIFHPGLLPDHETFFFKPLR